MSVDRFTELLGLDPIPHPQPIDVDLRMPARRIKGPVKPAASPEDQIAREAAAKIEREDGFDGCAEARLLGAYDGDAEHRIALKAIELFHQSTRDNGCANNAPLLNK
jgi:hypothetical protein